MNSTKYVLKYWIIIVTRALIAFCNNIISESKSLQHNVLLRSKNLSNKVITLIHIYKNNSISLVFSPNTNFLTKNKNFALINLSQLEKISTFFLVMHTFRTVHL